MFRSAFTTSKPATPKEVSEAPKAQVQPAVTASSAGGAKAKGASEVKALNLALEQGAGQEEEEDEEEGEEEEKKEAVMSTADEEAIKVYCRIRPLSASEKGHQALRPGQDNFQRCMTLADDPKDQCTVVL